MAAPIVELRNVTKRFVGVTAISDLSLQLHPGEVFCLLGENGAGKSTVIKILTGVETPTRGEVLIDGEVVRFASPRDAREKGIATVYQEIGTLPLMSVVRNFVLAAEPQKGRGLFRRLDMEEASRIALNSLRDLGISRVADGAQLVGTLSGGERQALAIGRAVHFGARVLVLDEPTAALGVRESATVLRLIERVRSRGVAVLFITHNAYHAYASGDRFMVLRRGEALAAFDKDERTIGEVIELMAGGAELKSLLTRSEAAISRP
jgi:simple sugar transport system ATP-binding protein